MPFCATIELNPVFPSNTYTTGQRFNSTWNIATQISQIFPIEKRDKRYYCFPFLIQKQHTRWSDTSNSTPTMLGIRLYGANSCAQTYSTSISSSLQQIGGWNCVLPYQTQGSISATTDLYLQESAINTPAMLIDTLLNLATVTLTFYSGQTLAQINPTNNGTFNGDTQFVVFLNFVEIEEDEDFAEIAGQLSSIKPLIF